MKRLHTLRVIPALPENLSPLRQIALDMYWTWNHDAIDLFRRLDQVLWKKCHQNPIKVLVEVSQERLKEASHDESFLSHLNRVVEKFKYYREERTWYSDEFKDSKDLCIAYFSAEFGFHESLPIYSGGLGVLAGDHLKAASDLGLPLVGVGLSYQRGYFRQYLNADGWQQENYPENEMFLMPIELMRDENDEPFECRVRIGSGDVALHIWKVTLGRIELYLLDSNVISNSEEDRKITANLYGGDSETRIKQEIVLGIGGINLLDKLGLKPTVFHMNEGHSAFLALERIRKLMASESLTFTEALHAAKASHVFTTHTPVPAGIDKFSQSLIAKYFQHYWPTLGLDKKAFLALGGVDINDPTSMFNMAIMAINLSSFINGVSKLHAEVSRKMWRNQWVGCHESEIPIINITNGVHAPSWISEDMRRLLDREIGPRWEENPLGKELWTRVRNISSEELWRMREHLRGRLVAYSRKRLRSQLLQRGVSLGSVERASDVLNMKTLTIGFARRFATYKRATLIFRDKERLTRILTNPNMPVQIIFAGKAHPKDDPGKEMIREIIHFARDDRVRNKIVFLEDYDIDVARHMVQGCDVWLNTPKRPYEASGTSGMKAAVNGVLNCSTLDGWWAEAFNPDIGWAIGKGETYEEKEYQDQVESEALYDLLEGEIIPMFYSRDRLDVPREWTKMIIKMLEEIFPVFITARMVHEYTKLAYFPCYERMQRLNKDNFKRTKNLTEWIDKIKSDWSDVRVLDVQRDKFSKLPVNRSFKLNCTIQLGKLSPSDVRVEAYMGVLSGNREISNAIGKPLHWIGEDNNGNAQYEADILCEDSGHFGFSVRVMPYHEDLNRPQDLGLIEWES